MSKQIEVPDDEEASAPTSRAAQNAKALASLGSAALTADGKVPPKPKPQTRKAAPNKLKSRLTAEPKRGQTAPTLRDKMGLSSPDQEQEPDAGVKRYKKSGDTQEILDRIYAESMSRVDIDNILAADTEDKYYIPEEYIPDGFSVEWKNTHIMGKEVDNAYHLKMQEGGWMPAPVEIFPHLVPAGYDLPHILRDGMILMIRPKQITEQVRDAEFQRARAQISDKMQQLTMTEKGNMDRVIDKFSKSYEAAPARGNAKSGMKIAD